MDNCILPVRPNKFILESKVRLVFAAAPVVVPSEVKILFIAGLLTALKPVPEEPLDPELPLVPFVPEEPLDPEEPLEPDVPFLPL